MTVRELIERLSGLPPDMAVTGDDYEEGRFPITEIIQEIDQVVIR